MTSSERMLTGRGVIGVKKNWPLEGKDRKAQTWPRGEFLSIFWNVGWLLKQEASGGVVGAKKNLPWEGKDREALFWLGEEFINLLISILNLQKECSGGRRGLLEGKELTLWREGWTSSRGRGLLEPKNLPWEGKDGEALSWLGEEFPLLPAGEPDMCSTCKSSSFLSLLVIPCSASYSSRTCCRLKRLL